MAGKSQQRRQRKKSELTAAQQQARKQRRSAYDREAIKRAEVIAEEKAPAIQRQAIVDQDGVIIRDPLADLDEKAGYYRRHYPLRKMVAKGTGGLNSVHLAAATRFSIDYEVGVLGASAGGGGGMERVDGFACMEPSELAEIAIRRYRAACDAITASHRTITQWVAIHGWPIEEVKTAAGIGYEKAIRYLVSGLDSLVDFYLPGRPTENSKEIQSIVDPKVSDIPQERLGRRVALENTA